MLKSRTSALILQKFCELQSDNINSESGPNTFTFREITKSKNAKMFYQNFDDRITANWVIVLRNRPLVKLRSPSDVGSRNKLQVLYQAWESNFQKLTEAEFKEWEDIWFNAAMN